MHPQYPQICPMARRGGSKSQGKNGQAFLNKPNNQKCQERSSTGQVQASLNRLTPGRLQHRRVHASPTSNARQGAAKASLTGEYEARCRKGKGDVL